VIIGRDPDTRDASGKVIKGKEHYADPKGAPQAWALLAMHPDYREVEVEEEEAAPTDAVPTREELIADLLSLIQTDPDIIAAAGLVKK
jgi:hypothetical protein